jgi:hypothetical protein
MGGFGGKITYKAVYFVNGACSKSSCSESYLDNAYKTVQSNSSRLK